MAEGEQKKSSVGGFVGPAANIALSQIGSKIGGAVGSLFGPAGTVIGTVAGRFLKWILAAIGAVIVIVLIFFFFFLVVIFIALLGFAGGRGATPAEAAPTGICSTIPTNLTDDGIERINNSIEVYKRVAAAKDVSWEMLAAVHFEETNNNPDPSVNPYQFDPPPANLDSLSFEEQTALAAEFLQGKATGPGGLGRPLRADMNPADPNDQASIKDAFWGYNGRAGYQVEWAEEHFGPGTPGYEGSFYVMNNWDAERVGLRIIGTTSDGQPINDIAVRDGAWKIFILLRNATYEGGRIAQLNEACVPDSDEVPYGCPIKDGSVTGSVFGQIVEGPGGLYAHRGIDVAGPDGGEVRATLSGQVTMARNNGTAGNEVDISTATFVVKYYHMYPDLKVSFDQNITQGTVVGRQDATGYSQGSHVHYEVWKDGGPVDPAPYIPVTGKGDLCSY